jgi:HSP20 family protein
VVICIADLQELFDDLVGQWKVAANNSGGMAGGFFWPSGSYVYGNTGRCRPGNQQQENGTQAAAGTMQLGLDVVSTDGFYLLYADVPGLAKADLSIKLSPKDRVLKLSGERKAPADWESGSWQQKQRKFGSFERAWQLPEDADSQGISAKVTEGVLTVTVPKKQAEAEVEEVEDISIN